jgi:hypothetical protein
MNDYYSGRSSRSAGLFSFGFLDGPQGITVSRNDRLTKTRPAHHLAGVHTRDTLYSPRRAPCEKPTGTGVSWRAWGGRVQWRLRSQPLRDAVHE